MTKVCVITGSGSGMGFETAKYMKDRLVILSGHTQSKLEHAVTELSVLGIEAIPFVCDTSNRQSVRALAQFAASKGEITTVINCAGLSPTMADSEKLLRVNALGTVYVNEEFSQSMESGSVIVDISSSSAYSLPSFIIPKRTYRLAETDEDAFLKKLLRLSSLPLNTYKKAGFAYALSKNFVVWYAQKSAFDLGKKGIRVVSLSPGLIDTGMGRKESSHGSYLINSTAEHRMGKPSELGYAIAALADERNGYLTGVDVLCDGGAMNGRQFCMAK